MVKVSRLVDRFPRSLSKTGWLVWFSCLLVPIIFVACRQTSDSEDIKHTRDPDALDVILMATTLPVPQPTGTSLAIVGDIDQPGPAETPVTVSADVNVPATPTQLVCASAYFFEPAPEVCPNGEPLTSAAAEQPFERGFMVWFEATDAIYVFDWDGRWQQFEDTFIEGQPENDPAIIPPPDLYQPVRGFGQ
ncbi:MAG: hypothetical protein WA996_16830, partial [Candidatus Promineifilaceae bacterium]